jgi:hypothetical protein
LPPHSQSQDAKNEKKQTEAAEMQYSQYILRNLLCSKLNKWPREHALVYSMAAIRGVNMPALKEQRVRDVRVEKIQDS